MPSIRGISSVESCRILTILFGVPVLCVALFSHLESAWVTGRMYLFAEEIRVFQICQLSPPDDTTIQCPSINLERFFIGVLIVFFLLSNIILIASLFKDLGEKKVIKFLDSGYHGIAGMLILVSAALYIMSAVQINNLLKNNMPISQVGDYRRVEKLLAGAMAIFLSMIYFGTSAVIAKRSRWDY